MLTKLKRWRLWWSKKKRHLICIEVQNFAKAMQDRLWENRHKGGWRGNREKIGCSREYIRKRLHEEIDELFDCSNSELLGEAADVANFIMMLCNNSGLLEDINNAD